MDSIPLRQFVAVVSILLVVVSIVNIPGTRYYDPVWGQAQAPTGISKVILVTWDGVRKYWVDQLMAEGTLKNLAGLKAQGTEIPIRIVDHVTVTDPGLATIETGYGVSITGIDQNYFGSLTKKSIPKGLTTFERLKSFTGGKWRTGLIMPWGQKSIDNPSIASGEDSTFWNARPDIDYWFSSENLSWKVPDAKIQFSLGSALLRANFVSSKVAEFVRANADRNFYVRTHWIEPDTIGHAYSESVDGKITSQYRQALIEVDQALGNLIKTVEDAGIAKQTLILVSTDHGFIGSGHSGPPYPDGDQEVTITWLVSSHSSIQNEVGWALQDDISPSILALAGVDVRALKPIYAETSRAVPIWEATKAMRETNPPEILSVNYPKVVTATQKFTVTVTARDESGIRTVRLWYAFGPIDFRSIELSTTDGTRFTGGVGPFSPGVTVRWYIQVIDNSIAYNSAFYPAQSQVLSFTVEGQPAAQQETQTLNPLVLGVSVLVLMGILGFSFLLRARKKRDSN